MNEETIRQIAYRLWEEQGKPEGMDFEHWLEAKREFDIQSGDGLRNSVTSAVAPLTQQRKARSVKQKAGKTKSSTSSSTA